MPRTARVVVPGMPHHVIQRGNRKQDVFFSAEDYQTYLGLMREQVDAGHFEITAYCLMPNHVHLVVVPMHEGALREIGRVHQRYTRYLNKKKDWSGFLWQGRFSSYTMDENYCYEAVRYIEMSPVRAGICKNPTNFRWSSARQRIGRESAHDLKVAQTTAAFTIADWDNYWSAAPQELEIVQKAPATGGVRLPLRRREYSSA